MSESSLVKALLAAIAGAAVGWGANALTLGGRVTAIEATLVRIEAHLYTVPAAPASSPKGNP